MIAYDLENGFQEIAPDKVQDNATPTNRLRLYSWFEI